MNKYISFKWCAVAALALSLSACDENAWNNRLDDFEEQNDKALENVQTIDYTLTAADYAAIASNSANIALAGQDNAASLAAVKTRQAFNDVVTAKEFVPAFLASTSFPYFTLTDGSAINLTYNTVVGLPAELNEAAAAKLYTVSEDNYMNDVWESKDNYAAAFAPSHPAAKFVPAILKDNVPAAEGDYCVVTYNQATQEPVFGGSSQDTPSWQPSDVLIDIAVGDDIKVNGVVTAICQQGYMITDNSATVLVYMGSSFDPASRAIGEQLTVEGTVGAYNKGLQITGSTATVTVVGTQEVKYPAPVVYDGAKLQASLARTGNEVAIYAQIKGKAVVTDRNINILVDGAETAQGSVYQGTAAQKAAFVNDAEVTLTGYYISISGGKYCNFVVTHVNGKACKPAKKAPKRAAAQLASSAVNMLYKYSGGKWAAAMGFVTLSPDDYAAMGRTSGDLNTATAAQYLPTFLKNKYPYAANGDTMNVMYLMYNATSKTTAYVADQYQLVDGVWKLFTGVITETNQFVRNKGVWMYDPTVTITLPAGRGQELSTKYFQACVDWVYENICVPLGDTSIKSGAFYVTSYGNNEYYSGTSAYQGNVDLRPSAARDQYPAGYANMSDDEIVALEKKRFMNEVMPGALSALHPDVQPIDGLDYFFVINFSVYTGSATIPYTARFRVVGPGKFEPVDCTWDN